MYVCFICKWYPHIKARKGCLACSYFSEEAFLTELEPHCSGKAEWLVANPGALPGSYFLMLGLQVHAVMSSILCGHWGSELKFS